MRSAMAACDSSGVGSDGDVDTEVRLCTVVGGDEVTDGENELIGIGGEKVLIGSGIVVTGRKTGGVIGADGGGDSAWSDDDGLLDDA